MFVLEDNFCRKSSNIWNIETSGIELQIQIYALTNFLSFAEYSFVLIATLSYSLNWFPESDSWVILVVVWNQILGQG